MCLRPPATSDRLGVPVPPRVLHPITLQLQPYSDALPSRPPYSPSAQVPQPFPFPFAGKSALIQTACRGRRWLNWLILH